MTRGEKLPATSASTRFTKCFAFERNGVFVDFSFASSLDDVFHPHGCKGKIVDKKHDTDE